MHGTRWWPPMVAVLLAVALVIPAPAGATGSSHGKKDDKKEHGSGHGNGHGNGHGHGHDHGHKGGVCSPRPRGCDREDCRCDDRETCVRCRQFVCRRDKKKPPQVLCRPCCRNKRGYVQCEPAPKIQHTQCVASPS
jgi:hypothetical protein